jgi:hypothetical protein
MSIFRNDTLGSWTRGGQAIVHNVRMTTQVFYQTILAGFIIWIIGTLWYAFEKSSEYERFVLLKLVEATISRRLPQPDGVASAKLYCIGGHAPEWKVRERRVCRAEPSPGVAELRWETDKRPVFKLLQIMILSALLHDIARVLL